MIPLEDPEPRIWGDVISGIALGALVGLLVGLSTSPVVGAVISGLVALLATYLGLDGTALPKKAGERAKSLRDISRSNVRIACFGASAIVGVLLGVFLRTHDALGISKADRLKEWKTLGLQDYEARHLVVLTELGLVPKTWPLPTDSGTVEVVKGGREREGTTTELYGASAEECRQLRPELFSATAEVVNAWTLQTGEWAEAAKVVSSLTRGEDQASAVQAIWDLACEQ